MMMMMMVVVVVALLICDHPGVLGACTVHSIFLILSRAPVNRGLPSIDNARWHTPRPIVRARWILVLWPPGLEGRLAHLLDGASGASGERGTERGLDDSYAVIDQSGLLLSDRAKTLTDDCSALYWTQELGLRCLESGRRAASNEPSCFSRR